MARVVRERLKAEVNVPEGDMVQFTTALGAASLGHQRLRKPKEAGVEVSRVAETVVQDGRLLSIRISPVFPQQTQVEWVRVWSN